MIPASELPSWQGSDSKECLGLSISAMEKCSMFLHWFSFFKNKHLALFRHSENYFRAGKVAPNTWEFQAHKYFKFCIFMHSWAITSPAFTGSNERRTQKRTEFSFHLHQPYSSYTGQMLRRSNSMSQPCPGLFHSDLWYSDIKMALQCALKFAFSFLFQENKGINLAEKPSISILKMLQLLLLSYLHVGYLATVQLPPLTKAALCSSPAVHFTSIILHRIQLVHPALERLFSPKTLT